MPIFRARVSFAGLRDGELRRLDRLIHELGGIGGTISVTGEFPLGSTYLFTGEYWTATAFSNWISGQLEGGIGYPIQIRVEKLDDEFGLPVID